MAASYNALLPVKRSDYWYLRRYIIERIARSLPDSTCKGSGDTGTDEGGTEVSMWSVCAGTAEEEGVNEVLGEDCGDEGVPCETDDRGGPGYDILKHKGGSVGGSELPTIEPLLLVFKNKDSQLLPLDLDEWRQSFKQDVHRARLMVTRTNL